MTAELSHPTKTTTDSLPLSGVTVLDAATLFAAPSAAALLADYGADVVKVEHPSGDPLRKFGAQKDGVPLWWKYAGRGKRSVTLNLAMAEGQEVFRKLAAGVDVVIENFRPGTLERWGLSYEALAEENPGLVLVRVTGFGQTGPYARRPAFGTLVEAMSGFAAMTGEPDGPPTLPGFPLGDGVCGAMAAFATMVALWERRRTGRGSVVDVSLLESLSSVLGAQPTVYQQTGFVAKRGGNRSRNNAPRNTYRTKDERWVAVSAGADGVAGRVVELVGRGDLQDEPWFATGEGRAAHVDEIDGAVAGWIAERTRDEVISAFEDAAAPIGPVYDVADFMDDQHVLARRSISEVEDEELGAIAMQCPPFRFADEPPRVRSAGPPLGKHTDEVYLGLGLTEEFLANLRTKGAI